MISGNQGNQFGAVWKAGSAEARSAKPVSVPNAGPSRPAADPPASGGSSGRDWWARDFDGVFQSDLPLRLVPPPAAPPSPAPVSAPVEGSVPTAPPEPGTEGAWWKQDFAGLFGDAAVVAAPEPAPEPESPQVRHALRAYREIMKLGSEPVVGRVNTRA